MKRKFGGGFGPVFRLFPSNNQQSPGEVDQDQVHAKEVQRQFDVENHEAELETKRKERNEWYGSFMKPYTMTVEENDLFYAQETDENGSSLEEVVEEERPSSYIEEEENNDSTRRCLRLPVRDEEVGQRRFIEATCTIWFSEHQPGDKAVWSSELRCKHAFHYDCILAWLAKGKKRCPICRDWFVPAARIEDRKKALAERLAREKHSATNGSDNVDGREREKSVKVQSSSDSDTASETSDFCGVTNENDSRIPSVKRMVQAALTWKIHRNWIINCHFRESMTMKQEVLAFYARRSRRWPKGFPKEQAR